VIGDDAARRPIGNELSAKQVRASGQSAAGALRAHCRLLADNSARMPSARSLACPRDTRLKIANQTIDPFLCVSFIAALHVISKQKLVSYTSKLHAAHATTQLIMHHFSSNKIMITDAAYPFNANAVAPSL